MKTRCVRELRETAMRLLTLAADLETGTRRTRPVESRAGTCTCDTCGDQCLCDRSGEQGLSWKRDGERIYRCRGRYRLDARPEPDYVRLKDGRVLNVTIDQLAAQNAVKHFHLPLDGPDCPLSDEAVQALADAMELSEEDVA